MKGFVGVGGIVVNRHFKYSTLKIQTEKDQNFYSGHLKLNDSLKNVEDPN